MILREEIIPVGKFQKTHALKGELNMISEIDPQYFVEGNPLIIENEGILVPYFVESIRPKGSTSFLVKIDGINSEEEASSFVNKEINMLKKDADEWLEEEIVEGNELIGYKVVDASNDTVIGEISDVDDSTSNVLFIVASTDEDIYIPASEDFIENIDEEQKIIRLRMPDGLLDINAKN